MGKSTKGNGEGGARAGRSRDGGGGSGGSIVPDNGGGFPDFDRGYKEAADPEGKYRISKNEFKIRGTDGLPLDQNGDVKVSRKYTGDAKKAMDIRENSIPNLKEFEKKISTSDKNIKQIQSKLGKYTKDEIKTELTKVNERLSSLVKTNDYTKWLSNPAGSLGGLKSQMFKGFSDITLDIRDNL